MTAAAENVSYTALVTDRRTRSRRNGGDWVQGTLRLDDGEELDCIWWDAALAPKVGDRVDVTGKLGTYDGRPQITARSTVVHADPSKLTLPQRLIRYYTDCIEEEARGRLQVRVQQGRSNVVVFSAGPAPVLTVDEADPLPLPLEEADRDWCQKQVVSARQGRVHVGYPLVEGDPGMQIPLFMAPARLTLDDDGAVLIQPERGSLETNHGALELLGVEGREAGPEIGDELDALADPMGMRATLQARLELLHERGLLVADDLNPEQLGPWPEGDKVSNLAILIIADATQFTRMLLADLNDLSNRPAPDLENGPLGALLQLKASPPSGEVRSVPIVTPSNLAQDRAIAAAMVDPLTVVTGPPGTGKSQVLVNTVGATLARGESVLFASQNNQAVDVVFTRVAKLGTYAFPLRAGNRTRRGQLAQEVDRALVLDPQPSGDWRELDRSWARIADQLDRIHGVSGERRTQRSALTQLHARREDLRRKVSRGLDGVQDLGRTRQALHRLDEARELYRQSLESWWPLTRRKAPERKRALWDAHAALRATLGPGENPLVDSGPAQVDVDGLLQALGKLERVREVEGKIESAEVALRALPSDRELESQLTGLQAERTSVGCRLFERHWKTCLSAASEETRKSAQDFRAVARGESGYLPKLMREILPMFPVWGVTNPSTRSNFPFEAKMFDLVIIDEASQCTVASALPLLYRAKRALIIGDRQQLRHISQVNAIQSLAIGERQGLTPDEAERYSHFNYSLFDLASRAIAGEPLFLNQHFRSVPGIIEFSNAKFYGHKLDVMRGPEPDIPPMTWVDVRGDFHRPGGRSAVNQAEAQRVIQVLEENWSAWANRDWSVGVVAPFRAHVDALQGLLARQLPKLAGKVTVDTVHSYQGDERDVMVVSPVVSSEMPERLVQFAAKDDLMNVALTRARTQLFVVGDLGACRRIDGLFRDLADYVDDLNHGRFQSPVERWLYEALKDRGLEPEPQKRVAGYYLDLAIEANGVKLDVECDGARFHQDRLRDEIRKRDLEVAGWSVWAVPASRIREDLAGCVGEVLGRLGLEG